MSAAGSPSLSGCRLEVFAQVSVGDAVSSAVNAEQAARFDTQQHHLPINDQEIQRRDHQKHLVGSALAALNGSSSLEVVAVAFLDLDRDHYSPPNACGEGNGAPKTAYAQLYKGGSI